MISNEEKRNTEEILHSYKKIPSQIKQFDIDIESVKLDCISYNGIDYSKEKLSKTYSVSSEVEDFIVEKEKQIEFLENNKKKLINLNKKIEIAINNFTSEQKVLFKLRYIENANWLRIITEMHISKDTYYKMKEQLILSAAQSMNPVRTLMEIEEMYKKGYYLEKDWK
ncbi:DUF1492 domain-containing protein [Peptostreptococcus russellii]|uniref:DUF1492 domain-containing protein n=1 Tax=Peptostreptococcus russellii TaxID=215200 RepID=A0A1H8KI96_9FIRM|nr:DUF1492 domain-containing protein [Peptostreptococcus russellii]SEN92138.1 Protein of unknown function [Peptostreptococcus russellii]